MENNNGTATRIAKVIAHGVVSGGNLNIRKRPTVESDSIMILQNGSPVSIISDRSPSFYKVRVDGIEGYCMKKFVSKEK